MRAFYRPSRHRERTQPRLESKCLNRWDRFCSSVSSTCNQNEACTWHGFILFVPSRAATSQAYIEPPCLTLYTNSLFWFNAAVGCSHSTDEASLSRFKPNQRVRVFTKGCCQPRKLGCTPAAAKSSMKAVLGFVCKGVSPVALVLWNCSITLQPTNLSSLQHVCRPRAQKLRSSHGQSFVDAI